MKPVESYSAINARMDRPTVNEATTKKTDAVSKTKPENQTDSKATTASQLAAEKPPFDMQKVSDVRAKLASGNYHVDTDALAEKMLEVGAFGLDSKK